MAISKRRTAHILVILPPDQQTTAGMPPLCSHQLPLATTRRGFLQRTGISLGTLALGSLFCDDARAASPFAQRKPPLPRNAKHVIHIFGAGAPSHLDTFDYNPTLNPPPFTPPPILPASAASAREIRTA